MDIRLTNLKLVLSELGLSGRIDTLDDRVTFQKAIYLAQAAGIPLRYRYSWYIMGPYSRDLTRDYYDLQEYPQDSSESDISHVVREPYSTTLTKLKSIMDVPEGVTLDQRSWLELLSSVHFLRKTAGLDESATQERLNLQKQGISSYASRAAEVLQEFDLIPM